MGNKMLVVALILAFVGLMLAPAAAVGAASSTLQPADAAGPLPEQELQGVNIARELKEMKAEMGELRASQAKLLGAFNNWTSLASPASATPYLLENEGAFKVGVSSQLRLFV
jgi:hypothetical protein